MHKNWIIAGLLIVLAGFAGYFFYTQQRPELIDNETPVEATEEPVATNPQPAAPVTSFVRPERKVGDTYDAFTVTSIEKYRKDSSIDISNNMMVTYVGTEVINGTYDYENEAIVGSVVSYIDAASQAKLPEWGVGIPVQSFCFLNSEAEIAALNESDDIKVGDQVAVTIDRIVYNYYPAGGCAQKVHATAIKKI